MATVVELPLGKLFIERDGDYLVAHYELPNVPVDKNRLGSCRLLMSALEDDRRRNAFIAFMRVFGEALKQVGEQHAKV